MHLLDAGAAAVGLQLQRQCDGERVGSAGWLVSMLPDQVLVVAVAFHAARRVPQKRPGVT